MRLSACRWILRSTIAATVLLIGNAGANATAGSRSVRPQPDEPLVLARERFEATSPAGEIGIEIDRSTHRRIVSTGRGLVRDFPLPDRAPVDLQLTAFNFVAPNARFVVSDENGERSVPAPDIRAFRGIVDGDPDSMAVLTFFEGRVAGFVRVWDAEFIVGPSDFNPARTRSAQPWVRRKRQIAEGQTAFECDTPPTLDRSATSSTPQRRLASDRDGRLVHVQPVADMPRTAPAAIGPETLLQASIAIDATVEFHDHFGSLTATQDYILNLMAQVSTIYELEVGVKFEVSYLRVFTGEPDPYTDGSESTSVLLDDMRAEWNANQTGVTRTVAHLFSKRSSGGAGRAYIDVLCSGSYGYGVSTLSANGGSWEKELVAHEFGHNFASPHTHCFVPEIDRCANQSGCWEGDLVPIEGTIMSYCSQSVPVFDARVKNEQIRPAAESAYPSCIDTAGLPGSIPHTGNSGLILSKPTACPTASLANDDGSANSYFGYGGTTQMAWIKRFTPACYPFRLTQAEVMIGHASSVTPGRAIRILVYGDAAGTGDPANATLLYSQDTTVQVVSSSSLNSYTLDDPVTISSGDYYVGFYDLEADAASTYIGTQDFSTEGDAYRTGGSTSPTSFNLHSGATWIIRASGGPVVPGSVLLEWDPACNDASTPGQDFAIYRGNIGDYSNKTTMTCSTLRATSHLASNPADGYFLIVPCTSANEGSYGLTGENLERAPAASACNPQSMDSCP